MSNPGSLSVLQLEASEIRDYEWTVQIPPRSRITENIDVFLKAAEINQTYRFSDLEFKEGFLGQIKHSWCFEIVKDCAIKLEFRIMKEGKLLVRKCLLQTFSDGRSKGTTTLDLTRAPPAYSQSHFIWSTDKGQRIPIMYWNDSVDRIKLIFTLHREHVGTCITSPSASWSGLNNRGEGLQWAQLNLLDKYLRSKQPDVTLVADQGHEFPAHRYLLSWMSPVFERMFEQGMKEALEGRVEIPDIRHEVLKELLNFLYNGEIATTDDNHDMMYVELFKVGHKYEMTGLMNKCGERIVDKVISFLNAGEMFTLGEVYSVDAFMQKAIQIMKWNKSQAFKDGESIGDFSTRFPKLAFEVLMK